MTTRTTFRPQTDAFAFDNSWPIDGWELNEIRRFLAHEHDGVVRALANSGVAHTIVRVIHERHLLDDVLRDEHLTRYGLCGGMAFAALDYYMHGWVVPQGTGPHDHPMHDKGAGRALRNYIWQRLLDSMQSRAARVMFAWSLALHLVPRLGAAWVLAQSKKEWTALKQRLDAGTPWPIGLVGDAHGSFANHQVLALGYDDPGDGIGAIVVYDSCCPVSAHTIALDFRGSSLVADESCSAGGGDAEWKGFFCDAYTPARPPIAVGLSDGLTVSPVSESDEGARVTVRYTARNDSFSRCPPLSLHVCGRSGADEGRQLDGGEKEPEPLEAGACRTFTQSIERAEPAGADDFRACCFLGTVDGVDVWKNIPHRW